MLPIDTSLKDLLKECRAPARRAKDKERRAAKRHAADLISKVQVQFWIHQKDAYAKLPKDLLTIPMRCRYSAVLDLLGAFHVKTLIMPDGTTGSVEDVEAFCKFSCSLLGDVFPVEGQKLTACDGNSSSVPNTSSARS